MRPTSSAGVVALVWSFSTSLRARSTHQPIEDYGNYYERVSSTTVSIVFPRLGVVNLFDRGCSSWIAAGFPRTGGPPHIPANTSMERAMVCTAAAVGK
ncbi:hypothetical protein IF2G_07564 [Cordyceps javanica]|nr:hypothetical protein IF2G_07564 [Cordyceps javanica]